MHKQILERSPVCSAYSNPRDNPFDHRTVNFKSVGTRTLFCSDSHTRLRLDPTATSFQCQCGHACRLDCTHFRETATWTCESVAQGMLPCFMNPTGSLAPAGTECGVLGQAGLAALIFWRQHGLAALLFWRQHGLVVLLFWRQHDACWWLTACRNG